jgi:hypothetical protein
VGLLFGKRDDKGVNRIPLSARMLSSALALVCALLLRRDAGDPLTRRQTGLVAAGMANGFVGDLIMAEVIPLPEHVLFGMLAFGAGHACYMRALLHGGGPRSRMGRWGWLCLAWAVALAGWRLLVHNPKISPALNYGALGYALLLSSMAGLAAERAEHDRRYAPVALGGGLFLISDMLLASRLFRGTHFAQIGDVVWLTYMGGQALIVAGMAAQQNQEPRTENQ